MSRIDRYIGSIDQGTSSTKFVIYNHNGQAVGVHQMEHKQVYPNPGWVEHDPMEIWVSHPPTLKGQSHSYRKTSLPLRRARRAPQDNTEQCIQKALQKSNIDRAQLEAIGITNQRESTVVWNK